MLKKAFIIAVALLAGGLFLLKELPLQARLTQKEGHLIGSVEQAEEVEKDIKEDVEEESVEKEGDDCLQEINRLNREELQLIDGIGEVYSGKIVEKDIKTEKDLKEISGIGEVTAEKIKEFVCSKSIDDIKKEEEIAEKDGGDESVVETVKVEEEDKIDEEKLLKLVELLKNYEGKEEVEEESVEKEEDIKDGTTTIKKIEINSADKKELQELDGIGPVYAKRIMEQRPFCSLGELTQVSGIGENTVDNIKNQNMATVDCKEEYSDKEEDLSEGEKDDLGKKLEEKDKEIQILGSRLDKVSSDLEKEKNINNDLESELLETRKMRDRCLFDYRVNINEAKKEDLTKIDGVGEKTAKNIIDFVADSPIDYIEELKEVDYVGEVTALKFIEAGFCTHEKVDDDEEKEEDDLEIKILTAPKNIYPNQSFEVEVKFLGFENLNYELKAKIKDKNEDTLKEKEANVELSEDKKTKALSFKIDEAEGFLDFFIYIKKEGEEIVKKEKEDLLKVKTPIEKHNVSFIEENELEDVKIEIYEDGEMENQIGGMINTNNEGKSEKEIKKGVYYFRATLEDYEDYQESFRLDDKDIEITFKMTEIIPENLLKNWHFEEWEDNETSKNWIWDETLSRIGKSEGGSLIGENNLWLKPIASHNILKQTVVGDPDTTYYGRVWAKSTDNAKVRVGIIGPGSSYGDYEELENNEWTKITHSRTSGDTEDISMAISVIESDEGDRPSIYIGAAWLSDQKPPENWPKQHNPHFAAPGAAK